MVQLVENLVKIFTSGKFMSIFTSGLLMTVEMSLGAAVLGLVLGTVVALSTCRSRRVRLWYCRACFARYT